VTLYQWFANTAAKHPDAPALEAGTDRLTYADLRTRAERVSAGITATVGDRPRAVGLCLPRGVAAYVGYLAVLRSGAAVVPLNPDLPAARNAMICRAVGVDTVLTDLPTDTAPETAVPASASRDDVAYVLFTSGSTGRPKGVPIRHRQLADYLPYCVRRYDAGPGARFSQAFELTFDPSVFDMFVAWTAGATVVAAAPEDLLAPADFVVRRRITHWFSVPSVISLARRLRGLKPGAMPNLRWSLFAGEQLTLDQANAWARAAPRSTVENLYGPTELTITCTAYRLPHDPARWPRTVNGTVPIGRPYPHVDVTVGADGELLVRGSQRFDGYLDANDNHGRFASATGAAPAGPPRRTDWYRTGDRVGWEDGELVHLGRVDDQAKIGGHRVEPGEIECVLRAHTGVHDAVVLAMPADGVVTLHAFYTGEPSAGPDLTEHARLRLPAYMVPARIHHVPRLPVTANGKIDRTRLSALAEK
jgi:amino acid adenylation domain-containing protein